MFFSLALLFDILFFGALLFFVSLIWIRFFLENTFLICFLSFILSGFLTCYLILLKYGKYKKNVLSNKQKLEYEYLKTLLLTSIPSIAIKEFNKIFCLTKNTNRLYKQFKSYYFVSNGGVFVGHNNIFIAFNFDGFCLQDCDLKKTINNIAKKKNLIFSELFIIGNLFSEKCYDLIKLYNFKITLLTLSDFYRNIISGLNIYSVKAKQKPKLKAQLKGILENLTNTKHFKKYIYLSFGLYLASFIMRYNIYYIIFASILSVLAIICKLKPKKIL